MAQSPVALKDWLSGSHKGELKFADLWKIILIRVADRAADVVDEEGRSIINRDGASYSYDLSLIVEEDDIQIGSKDLLRVALYLHEHDWGKITRRSPPKMILTAEGMDKANELINEILGEPEDNRSWAFGAENDFRDWLLVHGFRGFDLGKPYSNSSMVNFRAIADQYTRKISDSELSSALSDLELKDMIARDTGPVAGNFWAHFNHGGEVAAKLLEELWETRAAIPAADRFVRIDDNARGYTEAISHLEQLVTEMAEIRVNDWPEKEGMIVAVKGALNSLKTKYVNKKAILTAISSVTVFLAIKFIDQPISELAKATWAAVKNLLW